MGIVDLRAEEYLDIRRNLRTRKETINNMRIKNTAHITELPTLDNFIQEYDMGTRFAVYEAVLNAIENNSPCGYYQSDAFAMDVSYTMDMSEVPFTIFNRVVFPNASVEFELSLGSVDAEVVMGLDDHGMINDNRVRMYLKDAIGKNIGCRVHIRAQHQG